MAPSTKVISSSQAPEVTIFKSSTKPCSRIQRSLESKTSKSPDTPGSRAPFHLAPRAARRQITRTLRRREHMRLRTVMAAQTSPSRKRKLVVVSVMKIGSREITVRQRLRKLKDDDVS